MSTVMMSKIVPLRSELVSTISAGDLAVGTSVFLMENGTAVEYFIVHQGLPSALYDDSCDGTWLLRKDIYGTYKWYDGERNIYGESDIHTYLNNGFLNLFDVSMRTQIKTVNIPYVAGYGTSWSVASGSNGLSAKLFLLSGREVNLVTHSRIVDGACLNYFNETAETDNKRIATLYGDEAEWWLRTPCGDNTYRAAYITQSGSESIADVDHKYGVRPALILPKTAQFDSRTMLVAS